MSTGWSPSKTEYLTDTDSTREDGVKHSSLQALLNNAWESDSYLGSKPFSDLLGSGSCLGMSSVEVGVLFGQEHKMWGAMRRRKKAVIG